MYCYLSNTFLFFKFPVARTKHRRIKHRVLLGGNIRACRKVAGLTQERLSEKADLDSKYFSEVECGAVNISVDSLVKISKALKIPLSNLTKDI